MTTAFVQYAYRAKPDRAKPCYDGDTLYLWVDLGFDSWRYDKFRLLGVDTPELRGCSEEEKAYGYEAKAYVTAVLESQRNGALIKSHKDTKYGYGADVLVEHDDLAWPLPKPTLLSELIITNGHGVPYNGGTKLPWPERKKIMDAARALLP